ncbi:MAG: magnesium transporter [Candidatus Bathyarchaeota archaeon]|nr:MAG: magnesium transporter [Candidatus Bathyarchaeota archaeon]
MAASKIRQLSLAKTTSQSLLSLVFGLGDIIAGVIIAVSLSIFPHKHWIIALYPGVLSMRGVIGGLLSGKLSTGLHLGTIKTSLSGGKNKHLLLLLSSSSVVTFTSSILLGSIASIFAAFFGGIDVLTGLIIFSTLLATMGISLLVISPITIGVAFYSAKKGYDPDITIYPIVSTIADILVTLCYVLVLALSLRSGISQFLIFFFGLAFAVVVVVILFKNRKENELLQIIKEALITLILVAFIVNITGSLLSQMSGVLRSRPEIYVVYPALLNTIGGFGAIVGSTATTKLALGTMTSFRSIKHHKSQIFGAWLASAAIFLIISVISLPFQSPINFIQALKSVGVLLATNTLATASMVFISITVAVLTFQKGLDPDNFVIPIESSLADILTTISLVIMLSLAG